MRTEASIHNFFIFNPSFSCGKEENETKKNIFYYPSTDLSNVQSRNIGFVEAIVQFTDSFKPSSKVHTLHSRKKQQYYFLPEENYWMVLTVNLPNVKDNKDGKEIVDYLEELQENVLHPFLQQIYERFKLLHGSFSSVNLDTLKSKLTVFMSMYLRFVDLSKVTILSVLGGVRFLPLPKHPFLTIQCFLNALQSKFPAIKSTCFYYDDFIVSTGITLDNMRNLNRYLIENVIIRVKEEDIGSKIFSAPYQGKFIKDLPNIYFDNVKYNLVIYNVLKTYLIMLTTDFSLNTDCSRDLEIFIGPELVKLNAMIFEHRSKLTENPSARIIYFNRLNLAYKNSITASENDSESSSINEAVQLIADIRKKQEELGEKSGEIIVKALNGFWVAGKKSNSRELYIVLDNKKATLIDINDEIKKICDNELKGIYF